MAHADDLTPETARNNPGISKVQFFKDFDGGHAVGGSIATFAFGVSCGTHTHRGAAELFLVLEGEGVIEVDGTLHQIRKDSLVLVPAGAPHSVMGVSSAPCLRVFCALVVEPEHESDPEPWLPVE